MRSAAKDGKGEERKEALLFSLFPSSPAPLGSLSNDDGDDNDNDNATN